uniref:Uncharacterized protein n=1 Tax=Anguilla anguilla TaxID=7936 RepID=A0A0E9VJ98_ANGAN
MTQLFEQQKCTTFDILAPSCGLNRTFFYLGVTGIMRFMRQTKPQNKFTRSLITTAVNIPQTFKMDIVHS